MNVAIDCGTCPKRVRIAVADARRELRERNEYSFGLHVTDQRAFAMRWAIVRRGYRYEGGTIGKTTVTMTCPACWQRTRAKHPDALVMDEDSDLEQFAEEVAATLPTAPPEDWPTTLAQSIVDAERAPPTRETAAVPPDERGEEVVIGEVLAQPREPLHEQLQAAQYAPLIGANELRRRCAALMQIFERDYQLDTWSKIEDAVRVNAVADDRLVDDWIWLRSAMQALDLAPPPDPVGELMQAARYAQIVAAVLPVDAALDDAVATRLQAARRGAPRKLVPADTTVDRAAAREMVRTAFDCAYVRAWPNARPDEVDREWGEWLRDEAPTAVKQLFGIVAP